MKKLIIAISLFSLVACKKETNRTNLNDTNSKMSKSEMQTTARKKVIFDAAWDGWGRTSRNCDGWGLCNFQSCWNCEPFGKYSGTIEVDDVTKEGYLYVSLDPSEEIQNKAIQNKEIFYVDKDLEDKNATVHKGEYKFDSSIGKNGGYKISVTAK
jgi:hypothetical protein